jgi:acyl-CoA synthetase (AMP-forming)/AMP-acid ligase II
MSVAEAATLADVIRVQAQTRGDSIALVFEGRETSYRSLDRNANRVANGLIALGVKPNERIAYLGKNSDLFIELLIGAVKAKVVTAPVNWRLAGPEIAFIVDDAKAQRAVRRTGIRRSRTQPQATNAGRAHRHDHGRRRNRVAGLYGLA